MSLANLQSTNLCRRSLARSDHTLTVIANKAYIFGGYTESDGISSNDIHVVTLTHSGEPEFDYRLLPALPSEEGGNVPAARTKHAACAFNGCVAIYGGYDEKGHLINDGSAIWFFDPEQIAWHSLKGVNSDSAPGPMSNSRLFAHGHKLLLYGGTDFAGPTGAVWLFDTVGEHWTQLPSAPAVTTNAALAGGQLYLISGSDPMSSQLHHFDVASHNDETEWSTFTFPTNPMAPGPRPRKAGGLAAITTGYGRNYLVDFLGAREKPSNSIASPEDEAHDVTQWSDVWTLQLPSSDLEAKPRLSIGEAIKPAKIKDAIRSAFGTDSGKYSWAEAELQLPDLQTLEGKVHPGPRESFGFDMMEDGRSVVFWGGLNAKGERVGDGWIMKFK